MSGFQFVHVECYGRTAGKGKAGGRTLRSVVEEAEREPQACPHVDEPQPPNLLHGMMPSEAAAVAERFAAAQAFASVRGWSFEVVTEKHIRTPRLGNATFLLPYRQRPADAGIRAHLLIMLRSGPATVEALADAVGGDRGRALPTLWGMVARFEIGADLDRPLTMHSPLFLPEINHGRAL